ncbi:MAG: hypothetical protein AAGA70_00935 [Pseudomonadota bacterium]
MESDSSGSGGSRSTTKAAFFWTTKSKGNSTTFAGMVQGNSTKLILVALLTLVVCAAGVPFAIYWISGT